MRRAGKAFALVLLACAAFGAAAARADDIPPALKSLVAAANKEGEVSVTWAADTLGGPDGAKLFEGRMAKLYGAKVKVKWNPGRSMPEVGNEIAMRFTSGLPSPTDVYYGFSRNMADLVQYDMFLSAPWQDYAPGRITPEITERDDTFVKVQSAYTGFAVNKKLAPYIPTSLNDLLKPEWKGRIATTPFGAGFEMLSSNDLWGADHAIAWAKQFSGQVGTLARCVDMDRLLSGEFIALVTDCGGTSTMAAIAQGAPLEHVITPELAIVSFFYLAVPKNSEHPNASKLLVVYLLSEEGQKNIGSMRGGMDLNFLPNSKTGARIRKLEAEWGKTFVNADIAWQLGNEEGNKAQRVIKDIITQNKK
ncbi:MAG TPA: ABC transporter substrate-binding protein [Alphaproteobacteria bacterium]